MASELPRSLDTASKFALFLVSDLKDEKLIKKANLHENWNMQTLFWSLLNISAQLHQNWSLKFWAILFQSWCVFWDTVYFFDTFCEKSSQYGIILFRLTCGHAMNLT